MARKLGLLFIVLGLGLVFTSASAQDKKIDVEAIFKKLDANSDGKLSKMEFVALAERYKDKEKAKEKLTAVFEKIDPENKGLSKDQFRKYLDSVKKKDEPTRQRS